MNLAGLLQLIKALANLATIAIFCRGFDELQ